MIVYPSIDIRAGRCVRLAEEGDFTKEPLFYADPVETARRWTAAGAEWLHVVDLDGAVGKRPINTETVQRIRAAIDLPIELGGGLRTEDHIAAAFAIGVDRVVLGSVALSDPALVVSAVERWGGRIAVGLDARDGKLAANGWLEQTNQTVHEVARSLAQAGVACFTFTDIRRDGTLTGPNLDALRLLIAAVPADVISSGGVGTLDDVRAVADARAAGVIIGRALYDGRVDLAAAIEVARGMVTV
ncbi:MAG: 1-(5-phosphoribosyl)-5-[(5-phosphoribosylamino)methylideneamino]imidazole-4-carboxamide isomerase [Thermomicrobiales bacterium]